MLEVFFLSVGRGDAILTQTPDERRIPIEGEANAEARAFIRNGKVVLVFSEAENMPAVVVSCADSDVILFESLEAASRFMEAPDVRDGEYPLILDVAGTELEPRIEVEGRWLKRERVVLVPASPSTTRPDDLRALLVRVLEIHRDVAEGCASWPLEELVKRALMHQER